MLSIYCRGRARLLTSKEISHTQVSRAVLSCFNVPIKSTNTQLRYQHANVFSFFFFPFFCHSSCGIANAVYDPVTRPKTFVVIVANLSMFLSARVATMHLMDLHLPQY